jgi:hypothetical protein
MFNANSFNLSFFRNLTIKTKRFSFLTNIKNTDISKIILNKDNNNIFKKNEITNINKNKKKNKNIFQSQKYNFSIKDDIELPDHFKYEIPKYTKNPENVDFPWLIGGAPFLELKVKI